MSRDASSYSIRRPGLNAPAAGSSRSSTPNRGITLEEWESRAPLSDKQLQSISVVKERLGNRPLPQKVCISSPRSIPADKQFFNEDSSNAVAGPSRPSTPQATPRAKAVSQLLSQQSPTKSPRPSNVSTPRLENSGFLAPLDPLHPTSITTPQQFHEHFTALTLSTEHEQDSLYRDHLAEIVALRETCDGLINLLADGEGEVKEMLRCLEYVEERSESLRGACEDLLEEQASANSLEISKLTTRLTS